MENSRCLGFEVEEEAMYRFVKKNEKIAFKEMMIIIMEKKEGLTYNILPLEPIFKIYIEAEENNESKIENLDDSIASNDLPDKILESPLQNIDSKKIKLDHKKNNDLYNLAKSIKED